MNTMRFEIRFWDSPALVEVVLSGAPAVPALQQASLSVLDDPRWRPGMAVLWDIRQMDYIQATPTRKDVEDYADFHLLLTERLGNCPVASLVADELQFGMIRMWEILAETRQVNLRHKVFYSYDEALEWLKSQV